MHATRVHLLGTALADRARIAAVLLAMALGGCTGDADDPRWGTGREHLDEDIWLISDTGDFNADGADDILWNDADHSKAVIWLMESTDVLLRGVPISGPPGDAWNAAWAADFNADGIADMRWYNPETHESAIFLMAGTKLFLPGSVFPGPSGNGWERVSSVDFNDDGMADLFWDNAVTHTIEVWLMSGTKVLLKGPEVTSPLGYAWVSVRAGDFDADGLVDVLWRDSTTGFISISLMNGTTPFVQGTVIPPPPGAGWEVARATDFNADGMADVLWYNPVTQVMTVWLMSGTELLLQGPEIPAPPGDGWLLTTTGDLDADGLTDVIWFNAETPRFVVWLMAGTQVLRRGAEIPGPVGH